MNYSVYPYANLCYISLLKYTSAKDLDATASDTYRYLNFDQVSEFVEKASTVEMSSEVKLTKMYHKLIFSQS